MFLFRLYMLYFITGPTVPWHKLGHNGKLKHDCPKSLKIFKYYMLTYSSKLKVLNCMKYSSS